MNLQNQNLHILRLTMTLILLKFKINIHSIQNILQNLFYPYQYLLQGLCMYLGNDLRDVEYYTHIVYIKLSTILPCETQAITLISHRYMEITGNSI